MACREYLLISTDRDIKLFRAAGIYSGPTEAVNSPLKVPERTDTFEVERVDKAVGTDQSLQTIEVTMKPLSDLTPAIVIS